MVLRIDSKAVFRLILSHLKSDDLLIIPSVKIFGDSKEQALKTYVQLFDNGVVVYSIQEPYLNKI